MKTIEALAVVLFGIALIGLSLRWGLVPAVVLALILWLWRERTSPILFGAVAVTAGVFWAILNRQPWWLGGSVFWLPLTLVLVASEWLGFKWGRWRRLGTLSIALGFWFLITKYVS